MPALNFKKQFAPMVESGQKCTTIRAYRKRHFRAGDDLYFYTGMRTRYCRKLGQANCLSVFNIEIKGRIWINGEMLQNDEADKLAISDGFASSGELIRWFEDTYTIPFRGQLIKWDVLLELANG